MKNLCLYLGVTLLLISCKTESNPEEETALKTYTIEQFMDNEAVGGASFSPDNTKVLVHSNRSGIYNLYTVPAEGGEFSPVTQSDSASVFALSYFPNDERILFDMDGNGDEIYKIYMKDGEEVRRLTSAEGRALFRGWNKNNTGFYYLSNKQNGKQMDLYAMDTEGFEPELLYNNTKAYDLGPLSDDEKYLAVSKAINTNDSDLFLIDLSSGAETKVNTEQSANQAQDFSKDGKTLYYTTDAGSEFARLMAYDLATGERSVVASKDWDIVGFGLSRQGTYSITFSNEEAKNVIEVKEVASGQTLDLPSFEGKEIVDFSFSPDETKAIIRVGGSNMPTNMYVYDLQSKNLTPITDTLNEDIDEEHLVEAEVVRYPSFDGLEIPAIYYLPKQASAEEKVPALVWVHGGPGGQSRRGFSAVIQYLVNHGYAVLAVNNRGSSGYGKTFYRMDDQNHGDKDLKDVIAGKDWLATQPQIDADKIGIIGGSYGGFMTMAALTSAPEEFDVGVNLFGVTNWMRTLKSIPPWWESFKDALYEEMGNPYTSDSIRLKQISPLFHTDKITKPLIVLQGAQDPRVLKVESDEIVEGARQNGVPVEYVLFEDEGHGFVKKENQIEAYERTLKFLDKYLKGASEDADVPTEQELEMDVEE
ncbi:alpha/beta fold hydrolase [Croceiramulus getboli]|nr:S9 family peptidase [Flavobacteriaceae bacterium YJPT1-3]